MSHPFAALKIRTKLLLVILVSGICSGLFFFFLWSHRWNVWDFARQFPPFYWNKEEIIAQIQEKAKNYKLPSSEEDTDAADALAPLYADLDKYTGIFFYGNDGFYRAGCTARILENIPYDSFLYRSTELITDSPDYFCQYDIVFENETATMFITNYRYIGFVYSYGFFFAILCISLFLGSVLLFINSKIREILLINQEVSLMASGDLSHPIVSSSKDEIGSLSAELNQLRLALSSNILKEEEAKKSNQDLITSISHDLRTPLTILNGYLEILKLKSDDPKFLQTYLDRCLQKAADIKELTNRMFEYALVYEVDETPEFAPLSIRFLEQCLSDNLDFIHLAGFETNASPFPQTGLLRGDATMLKRVFTNLFSNILKYGDKKTAVTLQADCSKTLLTLRLTNAIKEDLSEVASNGIGLKSAKKMIELHHGTFHTHRDDHLFTAELTLPIDAEND